MEDPQEYKSLDQLFRKTFEELPETPATSGWDVPSPRVWEQVQANITTPKGGWTTQSLLLLSGLAVVLLLGLYWALSRPDLPESVKTEQPAARVESGPAVALPAASPEKETVVNPVAVTSTKQQPSFTPAGYPETKLQPEDIQPIEPVSEDDHNIRKPAGSAPLPGSAQAPNTTIRRQMEAWRAAPWAQPLEPLPSILKLQRKTVPPVPKRLKNIPPTGM
jgi:hypothetical protein